MEGFLSPPPQKHPLVPTGGGWVGDFMAVLCCTFGSPVIVPAARFCAPSSGSSVVWVVGFFSFLGGVFAFRYYLPFSFPLPPPHFSCSSFFIFTPLSIHIFVLSSHATTLLYSPSAPLLFLFSPLFSRRVVVLVLEEMSPGSQRSRLWTVRFYGFYGLYLRYTVYRVPMLEDTGVSHLIGNVVVYKKMGFIFFLGFDQV